MQILHIFMILCMHVAMAHCSFMVCLKWRYINLMIFFFSKSTKSSERQIQVSVFNNIVQISVSDLHLRSAELLDYAY